MIKSILNWPKTKNNRLVPWWLMGWRLMWAPVVYAGLVITFIALLVSNGSRAATRWWLTAS